MPDILLDGIRWAVVGANPGVDFEYTIKRRLWCVLPSSAFNSLAIQVVARTQTVMIRVSSGGFCRRCGKGLTSMSATEVINTPVADHAPECLVPLVTAPPPDYYEYEFSLSSLRTREVR